MPVYEPVSAERKADMLSHLLMLSRARLRENSGVGLEERGTLNPDLITNIRRFGYTPKPQQLHAISQSLNLTIGGAFELFGYSLESLRHLDFLINGSRTRLIEAYPFDRDQLIDVPAVIGHAKAFQQNSFLPDLVPSWRGGVPIRTIRGANWRRHRLIYGQIGINDDLGLPGIPPGSVVAIREVGEDERTKPHPDRHYFLQHRSGYSCSRCIADKGRLHFLNEGQKVDSRQEFLYPGEIRIVGRITFFAVQLPTLSRGKFSPDVLSGDASMVLPWEQKSFNSLLRIEKERVGITEEHLHKTAPFLVEQLGIKLSARTLRRYVQSGAQLPRTATLLAISAVLSLRISDVLQLLNLWIPDTKQFSLATLMSVEKAHQLPQLLDSPPSPVPASRWQEILEAWGEWPTLLSMTIPNFAARQFAILRLNQDGRFRGLDPLIRSGSFVLIDEGDITPPSNGAIEKGDWNRPIYAVRHEGETLCGYVECGKTHFALQPHPLAKIPRFLFRRNRVQILGRFVAVASPL